MGSFFRMIKMDFYRMKKMKILWAVLLMAAGMTAVVILRDALQINAVRQSNLSLEELCSKYSLLTINAALNGEKIPVIQLVGTSFSPFIFVICSGIFIPFFINDEGHYGFIKNICGQVVNRGIIAVSKLLSIFTFSIISALVIMGSSFICSKLFLGYIYTGNNIKDDLKTFLILLVLIIAVNFLITTVLFLCSNANAIVITAIFIFSGIQSLFSVIINMMLSQKNQIIILIIGLISIVVFSAASILIMSKKDVK